jgi:hypothetical protein
VPDSKLKEYIEKREMILKVADHTKRKVIQDLEATSHPRDKGTAVRVQKNYLQQIVGALGELEELKKFLTQEGLL